MAIGVDRARAAGALPDDSRSGPIDRFAAAAQHSGWLHRDLAREEGLAAAVAALRRDAGLAPDAMAWARKEHQLLAELLAAAESPDPVGWIAEHRAALAADLVLGEIAGQATKDFDFDTGQVRQVVHTGQSITAGDLRVTLRHVDFGTAGTLIASDITIPVPVPRRVTIASGATARIVTDLLWRGFEEMRDDCGYHYLIARYEEDLPGRDKGGLRTKSARQSCFPAIASAARQITLSCSGYDLDTIGLSGEDPPERHVEFVPVPLTFEVTR